MQRLFTIVTHHSIPPILLAMMVGVVSLVIWAPWWIWGFVLLGVPAQMLNEYSLHRFVFHLAPPQKQWAFNLLYEAHYGHHDFPTNTKLFFAPVWVSVTDDGDKLRDSLGCRIVCGACTCGHDCDRSCLSRRGRNVFGV